MQCRQLHSHWLGPALPQTPITSLSGWEFPRPGAQIQEGHSKQGCSSPALSSLRETLVISASELLQQLFGVPRLVSASWSCSTLSHCPIIPLSHCPIVPLSHCPRVRELGLPTAGLTKCPGKGDPIMNILQSSSQGHPTERKMAETPWNPWIQSGRAIQARLGVQNPSVF